jgi:hypothetical protein
MKVIPRLAWGIAVAIPLAVLSVFLFARMFQHHSGDEGRFVMALPILIGALMAVSIFIFVLLVGYIAGDSRRRGMRPVLWTLLAIFIPNAIGIILYFILREPLLRPCPKCGAGAKSAFPYCPSCGSSLAAVCPSCQNAVEPGWSHCARCGSLLPATSGPAPSQA